MFFWFKLYCSTVPIFFAIDLLWLGVVARGYYQQHLQTLLSPQVNWWAAITFYLLYISGILFFAVRPALASNSVAIALGYGALFGLFTYATYDLTNLATLKDWPMKIVVVDILWGTLLCTLVAGASYLVGQRLG